MRHWNLTGMRDTLAIVYLDRATTPWHKGLKNKRLSLDNSTAGLCPTPATSNLSELGGLLLRTH